MEIITIFPIFVMGLCLKTADNVSKQGCYVKHGGGTEQYLEPMVRQSVNVRLQGQGIATDHDQHRGPVLS